MKLAGLTTNWAFLICLLEKPGAIINKAAPTKTAPDDLSQRNATGAEGLVFAGSG